MAEKKVVIEFEFLANQGLEAIEQTKKQILELKTQKEVLKLQNKEETKEYALLDAQIKNLNKTLKSQQSALEANLKAIEANDGSLKSMREQLKSLVTAYDSLGKAERESESGQALAQKIAGLTQEIKDLEYETERYQRNVGNYGNSIQEALSVDTTPLKTQLRQLTAELQSLTLAQRQLGESMKTMTDPQEIAEAQAQYEKLGSAINDTAAKAGMLKDTVEDTGKVISAQADDYPAISALNEGITALVDSYTVLKGVTTALGIENDRLLDVMAKVQVLQQSVNALNRIAIALDKAKNGSLAIQQTSFYKLVAAKIADRKASLAQAKANATLTVSEGAATVGAGALRKALNALKASFMSIPGIGWIAAAAAAITALTVKIVKARKEAKAMAQDFDMQISGLSNVDKQAIVTKSNLLAMADAAMSAAQGSKEQEYWVRQVAQQTGVSYEYLKDHLDIMPQLIEKYAQLAYAQDLFKRAMEMSGEIADTSAKLQDFWTQIQSIGGSGKTYVENVKKAMENVTDETIKQTKTFKTLQKQVEYYKNDAHGLRLTIRGTTDDIGSVAQMAKSEIKDLQKEQDKILNEAKKNSEEGGTFMADIQKKAGASITKTNQTTAKTVETIWQKLYTRTLPKILEDFDKQTKDAMKDMADSFKPVYEAQRYLERTSTIDKYLETSRNVAIKLAKDLKGVYQILGDIQAIQDLELGLEWPWEKVELDAQDRASLNQVMTELETIIASFEPDVQKSLSGLFSDSFKKSLENINTDEGFITAILNIKSAIDQIRKSITESNQPVSRALQDQISNLETALNIMMKIKVYAQDSIPAIKTLMGDISKISNDLSNYLSEIDTNANEAMRDIYKFLEDVNNIEDFETMKLQIQTIVDETSRKKAKEELRAARAEYNDIYNLPVEVKIEMGESYDKMLDEAAAKVIQKELQLNKTLSDIRERDLKDAQQKAKEKKQAQVDSYMAIGQAANDAFGSLSQMFDQLAEKDSRYAKYSKAFALMQILTSTAISIASAVQGAMSAAAATGVAAPFTAPAFIAEMIAIVLGAIASATSVLAQAKTPHYAHGGYVDVGTTATADDVHAMVSKGEYIVQADAVKMYGKDYFDSLNAGLVRGDMDIANALRAALEDMPSPIVSVKEINSMQSRVRVKESISRQ